MHLSRASGILLHVSSLPGRYGIGGCGKEAYAWVDFLVRCGVKYWQILPLNPTGYGNSPYQGLSAFAGNPLFIDPENLRELGLLNKAALEHAPRFPVRKVDFDKVIRWKSRLFREAFANFKKSQNRALIREYEDFLANNASWIMDFALFMAIRQSFKQASWKEWPTGLKMRNSNALKDFEEKHQDDIQAHALLQFLFHRQWKALRDYTHRKGVFLIGDIPIFMGYDSADVWANPHLFQLDENREPLAVAGVPPDFFSATGQLWGNPLYDWEIHQQDGYGWWIQRIRETLKTVDLIRLDHFRGFAGYYRIPAGEVTAENGRWVPGPDRSLFDAMRREIGDLPFIAEDLGVITPDVVELRERYQFPGMKLLQFAFGGDADNEYLPHNYPCNCAAYTGTHDNNTSAGWYRSASEHERHLCASYLGGHTRDIAHEMIRAVWQSVAIIAIAPMQDFLRLGGWARMNTPSTTTGNWEWRMTASEIREDLADWVREINSAYSRAKGGKYPVN